MSPCYMKQRSSLEFDEKYYIPQLHTKKVS